MLDILIISCKPTKTCGKKVVEAFCNETINTITSHTAFLGEVTVYSKTMKLINYTDSRKASEQRLRFFDFSTLDIKPEMVDQLINNPSLVNMLSIQIAEVILITNIDDIYQEIPGSCFGFFPGQEIVDPGVSEFSKAIDKAIVNSRARAWAILTSSIPEAANPPIITDHLRCSGQGFYENMIFSFLNTEEKRNSLDTIKATWDNDIYNIGINGGVHYS